MSPISCALALLLLPSPRTGFEHNVAAVDTYLTRLAGFGYSGTVMIVEKGKVLFSKGYGYADRENRIGCAPDTVYEIGSLSKQFTATAIMQLEEAGKLKLTSTL